MNIHLILGELNDGEFNIPLYTMSYLLGTYGDKSGWKISGSDLRGYQAVYDTRQFHAVLRTYQNGEGHLHFTQVPEASLSFLRRVDHYFDHPADIEPDLHDLMKRIYG